MQRTFTRKVGRFEVGQSFDWPYQTWEGIAKSAKADLNSITRLTEDVVSSAVRGTKK